MTCAIMQQSLDPPPTVDQLAAAFAAVAGLTRYDGAMQAKDAYGILASGLEPQRAAALQQALRQQGVATLVADEAALPVLPPPKLLTRADPLPKALLLYDALGRPQEVPWNNVTFIAAGMVVLRSMERTLNLVLVNGPNGSALVPQMEFEERHVPHVMVELFVSSGLPPPRSEASGSKTSSPPSGERYRIKARQCSYAYLGASVGQRSKDNFLTFLRDLFRYATAAFRNRGAALLAGEKPRLMTYPSRRAFEEEITWCLWLKAQAGSA